MNIEQITSSAIDFLLHYGEKLIYCIIVYVVLRIVFKYLIKFADAAMIRANTGERIIHLVKSIIKTLFYVIISLVVLAAFDVPTTQFVALFSAIGVAFSLAVKDTLGNFAEGVIMMISKPFQPGDFIEVSGTSGTVQSIELVYTKLITGDNKTILIPNGEISNATIINYSVEAKRRLDITFSIGYDNDIETAKQIIKDTIEKHPFSINEPQVIYNVRQMGNESIDITAKIWVMKENYSQLELDLHESVGKILSENKIIMPRTRMDIHIVGKTAE